MSKVWEKFDLEIAATPMPEPYQNKIVSVPILHVIHTNYTRTYTFDIFGGCPGFLSFYVFVLQSACIFVACQIKYHTA